MPLLWLSCENSIFVLLVLLQNLLTLFRSLYLMVAMILADNTGRRCHTWYGIECVTYAR